MENAIRSRGEVCGLAFGSAGEASADVHRLARVCADEIAGKQLVLMGRRTTTPDLHAISDH